MKMLHITNGDGAANIIKASDVHGDVLAWRDPMHHGPFPANTTLDNLRPIRAKYLAGPGLDNGEVERDFRLRNEHLRGFKQYENIILWFEHDLLDQLQILQLLDWFSSQDLGEITLELICINSFPGFDTFRGIGQLAPDQMVSLFPQRVPVTPQMMDLARDGWHSFRSDTPQHLLDFVTRDLRSLPFLKDALLRHFEEYPSATHGLTRTEHQVLTLVENRIQDPHQLFMRNMALETALYLGDWGTYSVIEKLYHAGLLSCEPAPFWYFATTSQERTAFKQQELTLTEQGSNALAGNCDPTTVIHRDQWLGGVHLQSGARHWMWDSGEKRFVRLET